MYACPPVGEVPPQHPVTQLPYQGREVLAQDGVPPRGTVEENRLLPEFLAVLTLVAI
jgi:hypothetical protein